VKAPPSAVLAWDVLGLASAGGFVAGMWIIYPLSAFGRVVVYTDAYGEFWPEVALLIVATAWLASMFVRLLRFGRAPP